MKIILLKRGGYEFFELMHIVGSHHLHDLRDKAGGVRNSPLDKCTDDVLYIDLKGEMGGSLVDVVEHAHILINIDQINTN